MEDYTKDHDTSMALAWALMLPNDVATFAKENLETIRVLLVMQHIQVSIVTLVLFKLLIRYLMFFVFLLCRAFRKQQPSRTTW